MKSKSSDIDERLLVEGLLKGSERWLGLYYRTYSSPVRRFITSRVRLPDDAEEILQDTLLSSLDSLALFSRRSSLFTWLCSIARHEIADYYRRRTIKTIVFSKVPFVERFVSRALEPDAGFMRREYEQRVKQALSMILPHYRTALELKYMDGLSVAEISEQLGMSLKACESVLTRARKAFELAYEQTA